MNTNIISSSHASIHWKDTIVYPATGSSRVSVFDDANCKYILVSVAAGGVIDEHKSQRNATVNVIEGSGVLKIEDSDISLVAGVFAFVPANTRHAIKAEKNLAFLLTLSAHANNEQGEIFAVGKAVLIEENL